MMKVADHPQIVLCWVQHGCPACESYLPVFSGVAEKYARCVPSLIVACDDHPGAADLYRVNETPVTMLLRYGRRSFSSLTGAAEPAELEAFYQAAARGCVL